MYSTYVLQVPPTQSSFPRKESIWLVRRKPKGVLLDLDMICCTFAGLFSFPATFDRKIAFSVVSGAHVAAISYVALHESPHVCGTKPDQLNTSHLNANTIARRHIPARYITISDTHQKASHSPKSIVRGCFSFGTYDTSNQRKRGLK